MNHVEQINYNVLTFIDNDKIFENSILPKIINLYKYFDVSKFKLYLCVNNKFFNCKKIDNLTSTTMNSSLHL